MASRYTLDLDLVGFGLMTDLTFEMGDSDGDCQGATFCNNDVDTNADGIGDGVSVANADRNLDSLPDSDLDSDGLFDFSWTVRFFRPGDGNDFDSDDDTGVIPPYDSDTIGISFGFPEGSAVENTDGSWSYNIDYLAAAVGSGQEDRFALYAPPTATSGAIIYAGGFFFGGIACTGTPISEGGTGYTPPAMFHFILYTPGCSGSRCTPSCPGDLNNDNEHNFFDVSLFLQDYNAGGDYNGDGDTNFFDVAAFIQDYNAGCP